MAYYRLVQKAANGKITYSEILPVNRSKNPESYFVTYPNPVKEILTVKLVSGITEKTNLSIYDMSGRIVKVLALTLNKGEQFVRLNLSGLNNGNYVIKSVMNEKVQQQLIYKF